jgi:hypothetical protein
MKMRKLLPVLIIAVGSVFLLSGCDAILDAIFQTDVINVDVWVQGTSHADFANGGSTENLMLMDSSLNTLQNVTQSYSSYDGTFAHYYFSFSKLKDGLYYLTTSYTGQIIGFRGPSSNIYDNNGTFVGGSVTLPDKTLGDSTGHTVNIRMLAP